MFWRACFASTVGLRFSLKKFDMKKRVIAIVVATVVIAVVAGGLLYWLFMQPSAPPAVKPADINQPQDTPVTAPAPAPSFVDQALAKMALRDKVASLFILHTPSTDPAALVAYMATYKPGGLIFMGDNVPSDINNLRAQTSALVTDRQLPPFLAIDEEGDTVKRLATDTFPGALTLPYKPPSATKDAFAGRSDLLKGVGLNLNFGIIADVTANPKSFIYPRVLGTTPQAASERVAQAVEGSKGKTLSTIKHFPGHGETGADSHVSIPTAATTSYTDWQQRVALPFKAGIDAGADMVMFGQLRYTAIDQQPATLSKKWHDIIRNELGFKGAIITDDMIMLQDSGETAYADPVANAVAGLQAGNDLLLYVLNHDSQNSRIDPNTLIDGVVAAVNDGRISQSVIDERARNVLAMRHNLGRALYVAQ